jgi:hypothetical protein
MFRMQACAETEYQKPSLFELLPGPRKVLLGFRRQTLLELYEAGLIRIVWAHSPGRKYPVPIVHIPSLIGYIEREEELARRAKEEARATYPQPQPDTADLHAQASAQLLGYSPRPLP